VSPPPRGGRVGWGWRHDVSGGPSKTPKSSALARTPPASTPSPSRGRGDDVRDQRRARRSGGGEVADLGRAAGGGVRGGFAGDGGECMTAKLVCGFAAKLREAAARFTSLA